MRELISEADIQNRVGEIAGEISKDYADRLSIRKSIS